MLCAVDLPELTDVSALSCSCNKWRKMTPEEAAPFQQENVEFHCSQIRSRPGVTCADPPDPD